MSIVTAFCPYLLIYMYFLVNLKKNGFKGKQFLIILKICVSLMDSKSLILV